MANEYKVLAYEPESGSAYLSENGEIYHYLDPRPKARKLEADAHSMQHAVAALGYKVVDWQAHTLDELFAQVQTAQLQWHETHAVDTPSAPHLKESFKQLPAFMVKRLLKRAMHDFEQGINLEQARHTLSRLLETDIINKDSEKQQEIEQLLSNTKTSQNNANSPSPLINDYETS